MAIAGSSCAKAMEDKVFFDIAGEAGLNGKRATARSAGRGVDCRESAIHPARSLRTATICGPPCPDFIRVNPTIEIRFLDPGFRIS